MIMSLFWYQSSLEALGKKQLTMTIIVSLQNIHKISTWMYNQTK